jgi:hypothetical protein
MILLDRIFTVAQALFKKKDYPKIVRLGLRFCVNDLNASRRH